jgi:hypothetical protein
MVGACFCDYAATPMIDLSQSSNDSSWRKAGVRRYSYPALVDVCVVHARSEPSSAAAWETGLPTETVTSMLKKLSLTPK